MIKSRIDDPEITIGLYTLGLLDRKENETLQQLLNSDTAAAQCALTWENDFLTLVDALAPNEPPHALLEQILTALDLPLVHDAPEPIINEPIINEQNIDMALVRQRHSLPVGSRLRRSIWYGGGAIALMITVGATLVLLPGTPTEPPITIIELAPTQGAILQAPGQSSTPGWVVTIDVDGNVLMTPKVHTETPENASIQLWTYNKTLTQPRSLGLIDPNQPVTIPSALMGEIGNDQYLEMTLEPQGGAPSSEPTGPILFIGRVVTFGE